MQIAHILDLWPQNVKWLQQKVYNKKREAKNETFIIPERIWERN